MVSEFSSARGVAVLRCLCPAEEAEADVINPIFANECLDNFGNDAFLPAEDSEDEQEDFEYESLDTTEFMHYATALQTTCIAPHQSVEQWALGVLSVLKQVHPGLGPTRRIPIVGPWHVAHVSTGSVVFALAQGSPKLARP